MLKLRDSTIDTDLVTIGSSAIEYIAMKESSIRGAFV
ncbi:hypothetical protein FHR92_000300 [Fontibacillus solani]|uniref:Uncharacterized protein n=1 Tax=Fontibacillus solani TaxID=1572857 RepID=A0A7W3SPS8_9BACL|nr:hypothetical protein [Fontibacillus solani]